MSADQKRKLDEIGFVFDRRGAAWLESYHKLKSFFKKHRHCNVPLSFNKELVSWIRIQRIKYDKGQLETKQIELLNDLKMSWDPFKESWDAMFARLEKYNARASVRNARIIAMDRNLAIWLQKQRVKYKKGILEDVKIKKLESSGISWSPDAEFWNSMYEKLVQAKGKNGDCYIPYNHRDKRLFNWVTNQRALKKKGLLGLDRVKKLEAIGFVWNTVVGKWDRGFAVLEAFKARERHCLVPQRHIENRMKLGAWVNLQRASKDIMPAERKRRLEAIGFVWDPLNVAWEKGFTALAAFKSCEGHCNVPQRHIEGGFALGVWINSQRTNKINMTAERKKRLEKIGFAWRIK